MTVKFCMIFSVSPRENAPRNEYIVGKHDIKTVKRNVRAFEGKCIVAADRDEFWGGETSKSYQSAVLENPTWAQLFDCARAAQRKTLDLHHAFFEGVYRRGPVGAEETIEINGEHVAVLRLALGS